MVKANPSFIYTLRNHIMELSLCLFIPFCLNTIKLTSITKGRAAKQKVPYAERKFSFSRCVSCVKEDCYYNKPFYHTLRHLDSGNPGVFHNGFLA